MTLDGRLQEKLELHRLFWRGECPRPLLGFFFADPDEKPRAAPVGRWPNVDIDTPVDAILAKYAGPHWVEPGDRVPSVQLNYGTSFMPVLAGAGYEHDGYTSWTVPVGCGAEKLRIPAELDRDLPTWRSYEQKTRALAEVRVRDVIVTCQPMGGPMEMLLGLLGAERLLLDMFDAPEAVRERARECGRLWQQVFEAQWEMLGEPRVGCGPPGAVGFGVYLPGRSCLFTEDAMAMAGAEQFERFFREPVRGTAAVLETSFLHTHSAGWRCWPGLAGVEELDGVELSNDPKGPPLEKIIEAGVRLQQAGKSVMFSNWLRPLTERQVDSVLEAADPRRTFITLTVRDQAEAEGYIRKVSERFGADS
jgi:hypothetical protein